MWKVYVYLVNLHIENELTSCSFQARTEDYSAMIREIDGNEKVSEWMERNIVSDGVGCCDPISPLPELEHRVIQPDLLVQVTTTHTLFSSLEKNEF